MTKLCQSLVNQRTRREKPQGEAEKEKEQAKRKKKSCVLPIDGTALPYPATRLEEMLVHLRKRGFAAWEGGLMPVSAQVAKMRIDFQTLFEGPDIFCDDRWTTDAGVSVCKDGNLDSKNGFGRLEVEPFPSRSRFSGMEEARTGVRFHPGDITGHASTNCGICSFAQVQRMKGIRVAIRGMAASGQLFQLTQHRTETETKRFPTVRRRWKPKVPQRDNYDPLDLPERQGECRR